MSDNMNDKNENIDKTMVDEAVVDKTAEAEASETVDDAAIGDIAADESSADSIESIDFTWCTTMTTQRLQATILQMPPKPPMLQITLRMTRMTIRTWL